MKATRLSYCSGLFLPPTVFIISPVQKSGGRAVATSTVPSGAFRGFGAPQALHALEMHMTKAAREFRADPLDYRRPFFLKTGDPTITGGTIREEIILDQLIEKAVEVSDFRKKAGPLRKYPLERYRDFAYESRMRFYRRRRTEDY